MRDYANSGDSLARILGGDSRANRITGRRMPEAVRGVGRARLGDLDEEGGLLAGEGDGDLGFASLLG